MLMGQCRVLGTGAAAAVQVLLQQREEGVCVCV